MPEIMKRCCYLIPQRWLICALCSGTMLIYFLQRFTYEICMQEMVYERKVVNLNDTLSNCPFLLASTTTKFFRVSSVESEFFWNVDITQAIDTFFYIGFAIAVIPLGLVVDYRNTRGLLRIGLLLSTVIMFLYPTMARGGLVYFMIGRLVHGMAQAVFYPAVAVFGAHWMPYTQRTRFFGFIEAGKLSGWIIAEMLPVLVTRLQSSWEVKFYTVGGVVLVWTLVCWSLLCSRPSHCCHISDKEKKYIYEMSEGIRRKSLCPYGALCLPVCPMTPMQMMLTNGPFISLNIYNFGAEWFHLSIAYFARDYFRNVLHLTSRLTDVIILVSVSVAILSYVMTGVISDWFTIKRYVTRTTIRKMFAGLGNLLAFPVLMVLIGVGCNGYWHAAILVTLFFLRGMVHCNIHANVLDMTPHHAGICMAIIKFGGYFAFIFSHEVYMVIVKEKSDPTKWNLMGYVNSVIILVCTLQYLWFGDATLQSWNWSHGLPGSG